MPPVRPIKISLFIKILKHLGFEFDKQTGSHMIFKKDGCRRPVIVPNHGKELKKGTVKSNMRTIGIDNQQLEDLIKKCK